MTKAQAQALATKVAAAFPREWAFSGPLTNEVYVERLARLSRPAAAAAAIDALIDTETRLPTIAKIRQAYAEIFNRFDPPALEEPEPTPEERAENARRMRELAASVGLGSVTPDGDH